MQSQITFDAVAGHEYLIEVGGYGDAVGAGVLSVACSPGACVPPGQDCWTTSCGQSRCDFSAYPIPVDFFEPGSEPFDGVIELGGAGSVDTIFERLGEMCFPEPQPATAEVPIQLVQLGLVGCEPITVMTNGWPVLWDVQVGLSGPQLPGIMAATKEHPDGGTFTAVFFVQPVFTFTRVDPPYDVRVWDTDEQRLEPILMQTVADAPWSTDEAYEVCTLDGFAAGATVSPMGEPCCVEVCHSSYGVLLFEDCCRSPTCPECRE